MFKINKNSGWLINNYITYVITFCTSILVAKKLGISNFGEWAVINLIISYITQLNFGITHSFYNIVISIKADRNKTLLYLSNSLFLLFILSIIWIFVYFINIYFKIIDIDVLYKPIGLFIILSSTLTLFNALLSNYYRIYNNLKLLMIIPYIPPTLFILTILFFKNNFILEGLIYALFLSNLITFLLLIIKLKISIKKSILSEILKTSIFLFIYNTAFYFLLILTRSFYSYNTTISDFGIFTFGLTLSNAIYLFLESISFLAQTKLLDIFSRTKSNEITYYLLNKIRDISLVFNYTVVFSILLLSPIFFYFFPEYKQSIFSFKIALLINLVLANFGIMTLFMMSKMYIKKLSLFSSIAFLFLLLISSIITILKLNVNYILFSFFCSYIILGVMITIFSLKKLDVKTSFTNILFFYFPINLLVPFVLYFCAIWFDSIYLALFGYFLFFTLNRRHFSNLIYTFKKIVTNSDFFTI